MVGNPVGPLSRAEVKSIQHDLSTSAPQNPLPSKGLFSVFQAQPDDTCRPLSQISTQLKTIGDLDTTNQANIQPSDDIVPLDSWTDLLIEDVVLRETQRESTAAQRRDSLQLDGETLEQITMPTSLALSLHETEDRESVILEPQSRSPFAPFWSDSSCADLLDDCVEEDSPSQTLITSRSGHLPVTSIAYDSQSDRKREPRWTRHIDLLQAPAHQKELMHHWIHFLDLAMAPVVGLGRTPHNLLTPLALTGVTASSADSCGEIAVFHGLCAASAFNLSLLRNDDPHYQELGVKHRQLALCHLRNSMQNQPMAMEPILAAILTFLTQEGVTGRVSEWRVHLKGLESIILANPNLTAESEVVQGAYETYLCLTILGNVQTQADLKLLLKAVPQDLELIGPYHGVNRSVLEIVEEINALASTATGPTEASLERLELLLILQSPGKISRQGFDENSSKLLMNCAYVYHYATVIHFQRVLRKTEPDMLQEIVDIAIGHLEAIEAVGNSPLGCIWAWPCLVISAECMLPKLRARVLAWYECKKRHGFENLSVACKVSMEVWRRRADHVGSAGEIYWQDVTRGTEYDTLPL
ncbi:hypothetical protein VTL71DRAFT_16529 [Oculimacula yallundae]|uniref:Fungal-specific transcription factor domain-containing protein n=1 Tax=Oculimacula yallundae TaxID=86028 RepID=A0ABR4CGR2_9HELO